MTNRVMDPAAIAIDLTELPDDQIHDGAPRSGAVVLEIAEVPHVEIGVWEHTVGSSTDVEADEVFVVLSGRATVEVEGGDALSLAPGTLGVLAAGARTTWHVHETLRKVYITKG